MTRITAIRDNALAADGVDHSIELIDAKNIQTGDVVIKRPNRQTYTNRDVELENVKFVGGNVVCYQREQTKFCWKKLRDVFTEDDILENKSVEFL